MQRKTNGLVVFIGCFDWSSENQIKITLQRCDHGLNAKLIYHGREIQAICSSKKDIRKKDMCLYISFFDTQEYEVSIEANLTS